MRSASRRIGPQAEFTDPAARQGYACRFIAEVVATPEPILIGGPIKLPAVAIAEVRIYPPNRFHRLLRPTSGGRRPSCLPLPSAERCGICC